CVFDKDPSLLKEINSKFKIQEYMELMYFDKIPLDKYRFLATIINSDPYYTQLSDYNPNENSFLTDGEYFIKTELENLYKEMRKLGKSYDDEMDAIKNCNGIVEEKKAMSQELELAFTVVFRKIMNNNFINL